MLLENALKPKLKNNINILTSALEKFTIQNPQNAWLIKIITAIVALKLAEEDPNAEVVNPLQDRMEDVFE